MKTCFSLRPQVHVIAQLRTWGGKQPGIHVLAQLCFGPTARVGPPNCPRLKRGEARVSRPFPCSLPQGVTLRFSESQVFILKKWGNNYLFGWLWWWKNVSGNTVLTLKRFLRLRCHCLTLSVVVETTLYVYQTGLFLLDTQDYISQNPLHLGGLHAWVLANGMWTKDTAIAIRLLINTTKLCLLHTLLGASHRETGDRGEEEQPGPMGGKTPRPSSSGGTESHLLAANGAVRNRCSLFKLLRFRKCWPRNRTVLSWTTRERIIWLQAHLTLGELGFSPIKGHSDISPVLSGLAWG